MDVRVDGGLVLTPVTIHYRFLNRYRLQDAGLRMSNSGYYFYTYEPSHLTRKVMQEKVKEISVNWKSQDLDY